MTLERIPIPLDIVVFRDTDGWLQTGTVCTAPGPLSSAFQVSCPNYQGLVRVQPDRILSNHGPRPPSTLPPVRRSLAP